MGVREATCDGSRKMSRPSLRGPSRDEQHASRLKGLVLERAETSIVGRLEERLGRLHARQRLGIEADHEAQIFGQGLNFFHIENWYSIHSLIRLTLKLAGLYWRGVRNAESIQVRHNHISSPRLPSGFDGFTLLQVSDLHV